MASFTKMGGPILAKEHINNTELWQTFADNTTVGTSFETVANGNVDLTLPPIAGEDIDIVSASAADDGSPAGTGANTVTLDMLDENNNRVKETVTMNGTTEVAITEPNVSFVNDAFLATTGTGLAAAGAITIAAVTGGEVFAIIDAGANHIKNNTWRVPASHTGYVYGFWADCESVAAGQGSAEFVLQVAEKHSSGVANSETWQTVARMTVVELDSDVVAATGGNTAGPHYFQFPGGVPWVVPAGAMVRIAAKALSTAVAVHAGMQMIVHGEGAGTVVTTN